MRPILLLIGSLALASCSSSVPPAPGGTSRTPPIRVLMLTATAGFRHDSIAVARGTMSALGGATFTVVPTEDVAAINGAMLAGYDVLMFALTSGELPFSQDQKSAIVSFVSSGKGFVGIHSAADTLHDWPEYHTLVGAEFKEHPWTQRAVVAVEDPSHETAAGLGGSFELTDEFYTFVDNPRPRVHVLLRLDAASVGTTGDYPLAWTLTFGTGRVYYNALGHFQETWRDPRFQRQLTAAITWAAGR